MITNLYEEEYAQPDRAAYQAAMPPPTTSPTAPSTGRFASLNNYKRLKLRHDMPAVSRIDTLEQWLRDDVLPYDNALEYWSVRYDLYANTGRPVPALVRMAMDIFAIPSINAEVECVFSSLTLLITERRRRLGDDIINISECLRHWYGIPNADDFDPQPSASVDTADYDSDGNKYLHYL